MIKKVEILGFIPGLLFINCIQTLLKIPFCRGGRKSLVHVTDP